MHLQAAALNSANEPPNSPVGEFVMQSTFKSTMHYVQTFLDILFREDRFTVGTIVESGLIFDVCPFSHLLQSDYGLISQMSTINLMHLI